MSFRVETRLTRRAWLGSARAEGRDIISVAGAVKGGRSPAKRTLYSVRNANTLKGPSGGEDFPALGGGARGGAPEGLYGRSCGAEAVPHETE